MSWSFNPAAWTDGITLVHSFDYRNIASDIATWKANVDAGGFSLVDCGGIVLNAGKTVAIGTSTPWGIFTVVVGSYTTVSLTHQSPSTASFAVGLSGTELALFNSGVGSLAISLQTRNSGVDALTYPFALNPLGGNVGIGTSIPWSILTVVGSYTTVSLTHQSPSTASFAAGISATELAIFNLGSGSLAISLQTRHSGVDGQTYPLALNPLGGFVGIGTQSPTSPLQVVGIPIYASDSAAGTGGLTTGAMYKDSGGGAHFKL